MKHIQKFESFKVDEGWKENILTGIMLLFGSHAFSKDKAEVHKKISSESTMKALVKQGWSLDSTQIDTLWNSIKDKSPNSEIIATRLTLDKDQYFQSGDFKLTPEMENSIDSVLANILDTGGVLTNINIESSTDKQRISLNLKIELKKLGFTPDNPGLSNARSNSVMSVLKSLGVNDSLIKVEKKSEMGDGEINQSARYVYVDFYYIVTTQEPKAVSGNKSIKKTYYLSKELDNKTKSIHHNNVKVKKMGIIKSQNQRPPLKCPNFH